MHIALIADTFPPIRASGAVQLRDLSREFVRQGHSITVILPTPGLATSWVLESIDGVMVLRLHAPKNKDTNYIRRTINEILMPFVMLRNFRKSPVAKKRWDGVIWHSPTIFLGPIAKALMDASSCKGYLIIRDIFPEWALDMGLMGRTLPYKFFKVVANYQYSVAHVIGVQTPGNCGYFDRWRQQPGRQLEVLQNWLGNPAKVRCPIRVSETALAGRKVFVYAGNMGIAQGMDILLDLAEQLRSRLDVGFLFVGRGSDAARLKNAAKDRKLDNVLFYSEIDPDEIPDLYAQCSAGIVALDPRHKSHNIPGKFLTYLQSGLPVLATVNAGNDLAQMIREEQVGLVCESNQVDDLMQFAVQLLTQIELDGQMPSRCQSLFEREFAVEKTVRQIVAALSA
jgi:glycosyltransferase involved in cell wall biosynthesis